MAQADLLLALQILLDHDGLTEDAHTQTLWTIAQLLGGFENLGVCTQIRLLLRVLRMHVAEADWDAAPALSYLEQLQMLAKDAGLPAYVNNAGVAPLPKLLMQVKTQAILQQESQEDALAEMGKQFSSAAPGSDESARKVDLERVLANPSLKHTFTLDHSRASAGKEVHKYINTARDSLGPIIVEGGFYWRQHGGFFDPKGQLDPTAFISDASNGGLRRQTEQLHDVAGPSIMHQTLQTAAEATGQPAVMPPAAPRASRFSPQRTSTIADTVWETDQPRSVEQKVPRGRLKWTVEEDEKLTEWVETRGMGTCDWAGFIRQHEGQINPKRTAVDAKDRWRNIVKKREQLKDSIRVLDQVAAQQEQNRMEAERRDALLSVAETELQKSQDEDEPGTAAETVPDTEADVEQAPPAE